MKMQLDLPRLTIFLYESNEIKHQLVAHREILDYVQGVQANEIEVPVLVCVAAAGAFVSTSVLIKPYLNTPRFLQNWTGKVIFSSS